MGQYDDRLVAAIKTGSHDDLKKLEEPFARQAGLNPEHLAARKAATKAKYQRPLNLDGGDLRKAHATDPEPTIDLDEVEKCVERIENMAAVHKKIRMNRKKRP